MNNEELIMNSEELRENSEEYKHNVNVVGAESISAQIKSHHGITLIALIITIIIMLILAGVVLTLTIGENSIFKTSQIAVEEHKKARYKRRN